MKLKVIFLIILGSGLNGMDKYTLARDLQNDAVYHQRIRQAFEFYKMREEENKQAIAELEDIARKPVPKIVPIQKKLVS